MQQQVETNKTTGQQSQSKYVETIRDGAIGAGIFLATRKDGTQGHYFKVSRSYKPEGSEEFKYSELFYAKNGAAIAKVASAAAEKCEALDKTLTQ